MTDNTATAGADAPFTKRPSNDISAIAGSDDMAVVDESTSPSTSPSPPKDRRMSKEWDASKVPPSRFQRREGSIYSTPASRDAHVKGSERDKGYWDKLKEKGWLPGNQGHK